MFKIPAAMALWCKKHLDVSSLCEPLSWLGRYSERGRNPLVIEHEQSMRKSWEHAAEQLKLAFSTGSDLSEDKITGKVDGLRVVISNVSNFDIQRLVTTIRVFSDGLLPSSDNLQTSQLLAAYDDSLQKHGPTRGDLLSDKARAWMLGHTQGGGAELVNGDLLFRAAFTVEDASGIALVTRSMALMIRQMALCYTTS